MTASKIFMCSLRIVVAFRFCFQESSVQSILCRKILAAIEGDPDPEGHFLPVYCKMLSQLEVSEWEDIEELNFFRDKAEELVDVGFTEMLSSILK